MNERKFNLVEKLNNMVKLTQINGVYLNKNHHYSPTRGFPMMMNVDFISFYN